MDPAGRRSGAAQGAGAQAGLFGLAARTVFEYYRQFGVDEKTLKQMYGCQCLEIYDPKPGPSFTKAARVVRR
ncbi:hypothetical protein [Desulfovirgula thermocuniculi]|uniref:hypothetical protein n=1 Tax=Desulfovirgula thermocuniculi TaxID=348842 RepID=UPI000425FCE8|nr:hypothetical protein [Desulfovirgula thermocuniculi]